MYKAIRWSNSSNGNEYEVNTKSAYKVAQEFGRCEDGEVVQVCAKSGKLISEARWSSEDNKYYRCTI